MKKLILLTLTLLSVASPIFAMDYHNIPPQWRKLFSTAPLNPQEPKNFFRGLKIVGFQNDFEKPVTLLRFATQPEKVLTKNKYSKKRSFIASTPTEEVRIIDASSPFCFDENEIIINKNAFFNIIAHKKFSYVKISINERTITLKTGKNKVTKEFQPGEEMVLHIAKDGTINLLNKNQTCNLIRENRLCKCIKGLIPNNRPDLIQWFTKDLAKRIAYYATHGIFKQEIIDKLANNTLGPRDIEKHIHEINDYVGEINARRLCTAFDLYFQNKNNNEAKAEIYTILMS